MEKNYKAFYENANRESVYSYGAEADAHPFNKVLLLVKEHYIQRSNPKVLEIGAGNGRFQDIFDDYTGIDVAVNLKRFFHKKYEVIEDGKPYPFEDKEFDVIFTNAVFEHILDINFALKEMGRVLTDGGIIVFNPAWQCRPWAANGYQVRPYSDFGIMDKLYKASIPIRDNILFRLCHVMPKRFWHLICFIVNKKKYVDKLVYKKIQANYEVFWQSDSDACNNMDIFISMLYFKANNYEILNYSSLMSQFFARTNEIILRKK